MGKKEVGGDWERPKKIAMKHYKDSIKKEKENKDTKRNILTQNRREFENLKVIAICGKKQRK